MNMGDGKHATSLAVNRSACAGIETAALEIGTGSQRSDITATTFHETLRPAMCFLRTRAVLPSRSRIVSASKVASYTRDASASVCTLAQLLPSQMSEPWHVSKPARQTRCRLHISMGAGVTDGRRGDQWGLGALLLLLPLRYAAVVPAQNASGCLMPCPRTVTKRTIANIPANRTA